MMLKKTLSKVQTSLDRHPKTCLQTYIPNKNVDIEWIINDLKKHFGIECEMEFLSSLPTYSSSPDMRSELINIFCGNKRQLIFLDPEQLEEVTLSILESVILFSFGSYGNIRPIIIVLLKPILPELEVLHPILSVIKAVGNCIEFNRNKDIACSISNSFKCDITTEETVPPEVVGKGIEAVCRYLGYKEKGSLKIFQARGMIVGCAGAGKTTLLRRMIGQDVKKIKDEVTSTRGLQIYRSVFVLDNHSLISLNKSEKTLLSKNGQLTWKIREEGGEGLFIKAKLYF
ncbi:uncharacterized protein LOC134239446, partial [Saccostrea cucullata]|uniref:uncharacterized protein LOC134239446 n=1 Tax=Saccostrea cuccullata TaxID=36930 RepID=UPI002ED06E0B